MSPKIGLAIPFAVGLAAALEKRPPRYKVLACLAHARGAGRMLGQGDTGVVVGMTSGTWTVDQGARRIPAINVLGAILLSLQPSVLHDECPEGAVARALGVGVCFVEGMIDAWNGELQSTYWTGSDLHRKQYLTGYFCGSDALCLSSLYCNNCGSRRFKGTDSRCPGCDR